MDIKKENEKDINKVNIEDLLRESAKVGKREYRMLINVVNVKDVLKGKERVERKVNVKENVKV